MQLNGCPTKNCMWAPSLTSVCSLSQTCLLENCFRKGMTAKDSMISEEVKESVFIVFTCTVVTCRSFLTVSWLGRYWPVASLPLHIAEIQASNDTAFRTYLAHSCDSVANVNSLHIPLPCWWHSIEHSGTEPTPTVATYRPLLCNMYFIIQLLHPPM
jgi:hypothetical protein